MRPNTIRIIGGQWRGRRLNVLDQEGLRPTINRVRETLFNWLMHELNGARCLDLFAGTGALGLESLSRGAAFVQFVEYNKLAADNLQDNIKVLTKPKEMHAQVTHQSALVFLAKKPAEPYNIVFIDPPFQSALLSQSIELLITNSWLSDGSLIYLEQDINTKIDPKLIPATWTLHRHGRAGKSAYYLYIAKAECD